MRTIRLVGAALLALWPTVGAAQSAVGPEFQVNGYTTGAQGNASIAADAHGNFVVVWSADDGIWGRRFTASGVPREGEFLVQSSTAGYPRLPDVASAASGAFVVVWHANGRDGSDYGIFGQRFDANGVAAGGEFAVNTYTSGRQSFPSVAANAAGDFVVVWQSLGQDGGDYGIFGQRFNAAGAALGGEFQTMSFTMGFLGAQTVPTVEVDGAGNFVVAWVNRAAFFGPIEGRLAGQRYDSTGAAQGTEFLIDTTTAANEGRPRLAFDGSGNFMVVWSTSAGFPIPTSSASGRFFDATATPLGPVFGVNSGTGSNGGPTVAGDRNGNFVTTWTNRGREGAQFEIGVYARRFNLGAGALGNDFLVNTYTTGNQGTPSVVASPDENFTIVWESNQLGSTDVFGQRYGDRIFRDGVESGNLGRWSSAATDGDDLGVSLGAALAGTTLGIEAFVDDASPLFVQDDTPTAEDMYIARFYFDPNGFDPGEAQDHLRTRIFIGFDALNRRAFALVLRRRDGQYSLMGRVRLDNGARADTAFIPITDGEHMIEIAWRRSSGPGANNGLFMLTVDGSTELALPALDNDQSAIERVRLGALSVKAGASGSLYYDQFVSRRENPIGPE